MAIILPNNQSLALPTRRGVLLGATASILCAPAIVRTSSIMPVSPVRRVMLPEIVPVQTPYFTRPYFDAAAKAFLQGRAVPMRRGGHYQSFSEAERAVLAFFKNGYLSRARTEQIRLLYEDR